MRWCYISMLTSIFHIAPMIKAHDSYIFRTGLEQDVSPIRTERGISYLTIEIVQNTYFPVI
jgi:hypothetical protein